MSRTALSAFITLCALITWASAALSEETDADAIVNGAFNHLRGTASVSTVKMTIQRPDWKREMTIEGWTRGETESLFFITAPPKDKGNGTLKKGREMWTFNPKINRTIKLPPSMMSQSWMGSDFSNNDLAKSDSILNDYDHALEGTETHEGKKVHVIVSIPKPGAPVIWGKQRLKIREDRIMLSQEFFDEDQEPVKIMTCGDIGMLGGRLFPRWMKMHKTETPEEYTRLDYETLEFKDSLPDRLFTLSALKSPVR